MSNPRTMPEILDMFNRVVAGETLASVGARYGISGEQVRRHVWTALRHTNKPLYDEIYMSHRIGNPSPLATLRRRMGHNHGQAMPPGYAPR